MNLPKGTAAVLSACLAAVALGACNPEPESTERIDSCAELTLSSSVPVATPWPPDRAVPKTLEDSLVVLNEWITESEKQHLWCEDFDVVLRNLHFGLALRLRNSWRLNTESPLRTNLESIGLQHADDMSNFIALRFIHELHGKPFDADAYIERARNYWERIESSNSE